ncbi:hypothetical protein pb186bvf_001103 [Paramecium bursaria]
MQNFISKYSFVIHKSQWIKRQNRREQSRLKQINIYIPEFTGEGALHSWMDQKKLKILGKYFQDCRNQHRHTMKIDKKEVDKFVDVAQKYTEEHYMRQLQEKYWMKKHQEVQSACDEELDTLPYILKNEIERELTEKEKLYFENPDMDIKKQYTEQLLRILNEDDALNIELASRLAKISQDKLVQSE